ncbi:hypothetical protein ACFOON_13500 [Novosphingobium piscinae]|uniref:Uncharacterized protein n=1 Tax=Novosphingobium piscinae TaxID=1507448 RepID=A0A7X1FZE1_9SPHN|nr:hypothetical protein [Novosphingobium piscinae]MBC2669790.1 hypothetical protein [Novosphingobium piscinae]
MAMGDMTQCTTMGPSGGMSTTNCVPMGPDMATCNTMGSPGVSNGPVASPVAVYRMLFGDKTRKQIGKLLAAGDCAGAARYAFEHDRLEFGLKIQQTCRSSDAQAFATLDRLPAPASRPSVAQQAPATLYETVYQLAKASAVPFTADTQAGPVSITKIEAFDTQLRLNVQVADQANMAAMASPANLQIICADPELSRVLRMGGSIRLSFSRKNGVPLGASTQSGQLCGY